MGKGKPYAHPKLLGGRVDGFYRQIMSVFLILQMIRFCKTASTAVDSNAEWCLACLDTCAEFYKGGS